MACYCGHEKLYHYVKHRGTNLACQYPIKPGGVPVSWHGGTPYRCSCNCKNFKLDPNSAEAKPPKKRGKPCDNCGCGKGKHFEVTDFPNALCECGCDRYAYTSET